MEWNPRLANEMAAILSQVEKNQQMGQTRLRTLAEEYLRLYLLIREELEDQDPAGMAMFRDAIPDAGKVLAKAFIRLAEDEVDTPILVAGLGYAMMVAQVDTLDFTLMHMGLAFAAGYNASKPSAPD